MGISNRLHVVSEVRDGDRGEDHAGVFQGDDCLIVAVADGAGGTGSGAFAANAVIEAAVALANGDHKSPAMALLASEQAMFAVGGQSTGIIVSVTDDSFHGASVGDSECWWLVDGGFVDLTAAQARKPLLGDGAMPVPFGPFPLTGRLLVATDGLFNYAHSDHILQITTDSDIDTVAQQLADLPRLPDGEWPDDMALILINLEAAQLIDHEHL